VSVQSSSRGECTDERIDAFPPDRRTARNSGSEIQRSYVGSWAVGLGVGESAGAVAGLEQPLAPVRNVVTAPRTRRREDEDITIDYTFPDKYVRGSISHVRGNGR
jgi:hypothetical protein